MLFSRWSVHRSKRLKPPRAKSEQRLHVLDWSAQHRAWAALDDGRCIKSGCFTINEMISSSLKFFFANSSSR
jgi:hypothetical protein